jgi:hypothetical protein
MNYADSLSAFLSDIKESKYQFTEKKMTPENRYFVSIPFKTFEELYSNYCFRLAYTQKSLED